MLIEGDFNNGAQWDKPGRADNFTELADELAKVGLVSAYHRITGESFGAESTATFFSQRRERQPYHIDYCFIPEAWCGRLKGVDVGTYEDWIALSDHMPMTIDICE